MTPEAATETSKEPSVEAPQQKAESELVASAPEVAAAAREPAPAEPLPSAQSEPTETKEEAAAASSSS